VNIKYRNGLFSNTYGHYVGGVLRKERFFGPIWGHDDKRYRTVFGYNIHKVRMWFVHKWWDFQNRNDPDWGQGGG